LLTFINIARTKYIANKPLYNKRFRIFTTRLTMKLTIK